MSQLNLLNIFSITFLSVFLTTSSLCSTATPSIHLDLSHNNKQYDDFSVNEVIVAGPKEVVITCGNGRDEDVEHTMYPSDPVSKMLLPPEGNDFTSAVEKEVASHSFYRSSDLNFEVKKAKDVPVSVKISRTVDTLIMAKDPENFSLNFACKYQSKDGSNAPVYKWVTIKFEAVYPMAYGCETGNNMLFKNTIPKLDWLNHDDVEEECLITLEPNMLFGIFCEKGERIWPKNCINDDDYKKMNHAISSYSLPWSPTVYRSMSRLSPRFKLFQVSPNEIVKNINIRCYCQNKERITRKITIKKLVNKSIDFYRLLSTADKNDASVFHRMEYLEPGSKNGFNIPLSGTFKLGSFGMVSGRIFPSNLTYNAYYSLGSSPFVLSRLRQFIGYDGVGISYTKYKGKMKYTFNYKKDSTLVAKTESPSMYIQWLLTPLFTTKIREYTFTLMLNILPSDPYTFGCGVDSADLFRKDGFKLSTNTEDEDVTECKINPYLTSPVGFYCPKDHTLEPSNCFEEMINATNNEKVKLSDFAPLARTVESKNIRIVDFNLPKKMKKEIIYNKDMLSCRCRDKNGEVRARIVLDLRNPMDSEVIEEYAD
uniref:6-Cys domain-containing protein n=1 Tax=Babesia bovis TaxID=5865 RepID=A0A0S3J401_BABBO|nr:hypothetical protein [Babesia bovis]